jgi:Trypsin
MFSCKSRNQSHAQQKAVFDSDDRKDLFDVQDSKISNFAAHVALLSDDPGIASPFLAMDMPLAGQSFNRYVRSQCGKPLCSSERFRNQSVMGYCTGFLVSKNVLATAAHCIKGRPIESIKILLNVSLKSSSDMTPLVVPANNIYFIAQVLKAEFGLTQVGNDFFQMDYALVELNRDVENYTPWIDLNPQTYDVGQSVQCWGIHQDLH